MKKILSTLLVAAMLLSLAIVAVMPTAAVEGGDWTTWGEAIQYDPNTPDDSKTDVSGYGYNVGKFDGFTATGADWNHQSPFTHIQSANAYDLKNGIYFEVVVEEYDYTAGDRWFNVNIWSQAKFAPPSPNPAYGHGVQTLLRGGKEAGNITGIQWVTEEWTTVGNSAVAEENRLVETIGEGDDAVKYDKFVVEVTYDATAGYHMTINGVALAAPTGETVNKVDKYLNETFGENSMVYVGFALHNTSAGANQVATVTKFGTNKTDATTPTGNYSKDPENYSKNLVIAEPMDPNLVGEGEPAILMTGNLAASDLWSLPSTSTGSLISITDDFSVAVTGKGGTNDAGTWKVDMSKNYNIKDFPTYMVITKNLCTCGGDDKTECEAWEEAKIYYMVGDMVGAENGKTADVWVCDEAVVIGGDVYHYFTVDLVDEHGEVVINKDGTTMADGGRINGVRLDVLDLDASNPESLSFEVCAMGFFRTLDDAEGYALDYFAALEGTQPPVGGGETNAPETDPETQAPETQAPETEPETQAPETQAPETEPETQAPVVDETQAPVVDETQAPVVDETQAPVVDETDEETTKKAEETTKKAEETTKKAEQTTEAPKGEEKKGCGSVVGFGAVAVVVAVAAGFVSFKKKED